MVKRLQRIRQFVNRIIPPVNTPLRIALASFILSELITGGLLWLIYRSLSLPAFLIAGVCSLLIPFLISSRILQQHRIIQEKNRQLEKLTDQFRHANHSLSERNAQLDAFSYTVAHDLQSPLHAVTGLTQLLEENYTKASPEMVQEHLRMIGQTTQKMSRIVDEILLLSQIRVAQALPLEPLDMASIVKEAKDYVIAIDKHDAKLFIPERWPTAVGYGPWVEQVWINYLNNALKYGGRPPIITLGADLRKRDIRFWIQDNGPGLTREEQEALFVPFKRLDDVRVQGFGLGLSIVRNIVERLGGEVGVESNAVPGEGCCFYFTLPRAAEETMHHASNPLASQITDHAGRRAPSAQSATISQRDRAEDLAAP